MKEFKMKKKIHEDFLKIEQAVLDSYVVDQISIGIIIIRLFIIKDALLIFNEFTKLW
jgi:hypothetical protein